MPYRFRTVRRAVALVAALAAVGWAAPAAQAAEIPFTNWTVKGNLTVAKLKQDVVLPPGSTFDGVLETTTQQLTGHVAVPRFTTRFTVLGVPADATLELVSPDRPRPGWCSEGPRRSTASRRSRSISGS